jgi:hypothetical protein
MGLRIGQRRAVTTSGRYWIVRDDMAASSGGLVFVPVSEERADVSCELVEPVVSELGMTYWQVRFTYSHVMGRRRTLPNSSNPLTCVNVRRQTPPDAPHLTTDQEVAASKPAERTLPALLGAS